MTAKESKLEISYEAAVEIHARRGNQNWIHIISMIRNQIFGIWHVTKQDNLTSMNILTSDIRYPKVYIKELNK